MKILFLVPYPLKEAPSQRFRFEQYFSILTRAGIKYHVQSFLSTKNWRLFAASGHLPAKGMALTIGFIKRVAILFQVIGYDFIFIHREASPLGPPVFEWILARVFRKKIIFDFDDAIWLTDRQNENQLLKLIKWRSKIQSICSWSYKVSAGNAYLAAFAKQFCRRTVLLPTTIDAKHHSLSKKIKKNEDVVTIGWTGTYSTLKYLYPLKEVLAQLINKYPHVNMVIIADQRPAFEIPRLNYIPWSLDTEIEDLSQIDIGIMPLPIDEWAKGKCGFKALQYMSLEIPTVASPVGVNSEIIQNGINGFLADADEQWFVSLEKLILSSELRQTIGKAGSATVNSHYSVDSNAAVFLSLFK